MGGRQTGEPDRLAAKRGVMGAFTLFARNLAEMPEFIFFNKIRPQAQYGDGGVRWRRKKLWD